MSPRTALRRFDVEIVATSGSPPTQKALIRRPEEPVGGAPGRPQYPVLGYVVAGQRAWCFMDADGAVVVPPSAAWDGITGKPATFAPALHNLFSSSHPDVDAADVLAADDVLVYDGAAAKWKASKLTNVHINPAAAIAESKLSLASDAAAGTASRRTLGTGAQQAAAGNHNHDTVYQALASQKKVRKTADQSVLNSTTLVNDTALFFVIAAGEAWAFEFSLWYTGSTTGDIKIALTVPTGFSALRWTALGQPTTATAAGAPTQANTVTASGTAVAFGALGTTVFTHILVKGYVLNGTTAGNVQLQFAQNALDATSATTMQDGSYLIAEKL